MVGGVITTHYPPLTTHRFFILHHKIHAGDVALIGSQNKNLVPPLDRLSKKKPVPDDVDNILYLLRILGFCLVLVLKLLQPLDIFPNQRGVFVFGETTGRVPGVGFRGTATVTPDP